VATEQEAEAVQVIAKTADVIRLVADGPRQRGTKLILSITMLPGSVLAAVSASHCESGFCSRVETRAYLPRFSLVSGHDLPRLRVSRSCHRGTSRARDSLLIWPGLSGTADGLGDHGRAWLLSGP
jgi:hypothetical protein